MRLVATLACAQLAAASASHWKSQQFKSVVTFGDSYTDESRANYMSQHNTSAPPPPGWVNPVNNDTSSGGYIWPRYVAEYAKVNLYDYAVSGAVCSNKISPHWFAQINDNFPSVHEYEIPAYLADSKLSNASGPFLDIPPSETVYSMWIGTNDLGASFITDSQVPGKTIPDYTECVFSALDKIYANGARYFILQNLAPLQLAPLYATPERHGVYAIEQGNASTNVTEISYRMWEIVTTTNNIYKYQTPFELLVQKRYPGAHFAVMDMYNILRDMYFNPEQYFEHPANVTGFINHCYPSNSSNCARLPNPNSYMWYNSLHPSEKTDTHIAQRYIEVFKGESKYATYWS